MVGGRLWLLGALLGLSCLVSCQGESPSSRMRPREGVRLSLDREALREDPGELCKALTMSHREARLRLGPHRYKGHLSLKTQVEGSDEVSLEVEALLEQGEGEAFHVEITNSRGLGREAIGVGESLYVRNRYGPFLQRRPRPNEGESWREDAFAMVADLVRALGGRIRPSAQAEGERLGRKVWPFGLALGINPLAVEREGAKGWLEPWEGLAEAKDLTGQVVLDVQEAVPLLADLQATFLIRREGREGRMMVQARTEITDIGAAVEVTPPEEILPTLRDRPIHEARQILKPFQKHILKEYLTPPAAGEGH